MLSGVFPVFHIKSKGVPQRSKTQAKGTEKTPLQSLTCSPSSLFVSFSVRLLTCIHISVVSLMAACYVICVCVSLCTDNSCSDLSWTALEGGGSCLLLYWGTCLLYCKDEGPWILDILPLSSLLLLLPSHLDTVTLCSDLFFFPLSDSIWHRHFLKCMCLLLAACTYPSYVS